MYEQAQLVAKLRLLIDVLGYSQRDIADACGVSQQSVSRWRNGQSAPGSARLAHLMARLVELEDVARERLTVPASIGPMTTAFIQTTGLPPDFGELLPPGPLRSVRAVWNPVYEDALGTLLGTRMPCHVRVPLGHGASTLARAIEQGQRELAGATGSIAVRLAVERLLAEADDDDVSERVAYSRILPLSHEPLDEDGSPPLAALADPGQVTALVERIVARHVDHELRTVAFGHRLGPTLHSEVVDALDAGGDQAWRRALELCGADASLVVVTDLSPSPAGRRYADSVDVVRPGHRALAERILGAVAAVVEGVPNVRHTVIDSDPTAPPPSLPLPEGRQWQEIILPPLDRQDMWEILAGAGGTTASELAVIVDPRVVPDLARRGLASAAWELKRRLELALANAHDHAGVIRADDASSATATLLARIERLEQELHALRQERTGGVLDQAASG
ncbi:MAG TPA: helix-turn-helix transcriptional regulator [Iamia sp.]|nr:helix-turn-helix transcriptional regulator [Iamia sp.]